MSLTESFENLSIPKIFSPPRESLNYTHSLMIYYSSTKHWVLHSNDVYNYNMLTTASFIILRSFLLYTESSCYQILSLLGKKLKSLEQRFLSTGYSVSTNMADYINSLGYHVQDFFISESDEFLELQGLTNNHETKIDTYDNDCWLSM